MLTAMTATSMTPVWQLLVGMEKPKVAKKRECRCHGKRGRSVSARARRTRRACTRRTRTVLVTRDCVTDVIILRKSADGGLAPVFLYRCTSSTEASVTV